MCPGLNHSYQFGRTFYTLQTDSGLYLSHPEHYRSGTGKRVFDYLKYSGKNGVEKAHISTDCALTDKWWCAWVTYSLEDLRKVYQYISSRFTQEPERPRHPCVGEFIRGNHGMTTMKGLRRLTDAEIKRARQMIRKSAQITTASQLKLELKKHYSGAELTQGMLPGIPSQKKSSSPQRPVRRLKKQKKRITPTKSKTVVGLFGYTLPNMPTEKQGERR